MHKVIQDILCGMILNSFNYQDAFRQDQECRENFRRGAQGKIYVMTALIEYFTVLLDSSWGPKAEWDPGQNAPVTPPLGGPASDLDVRQ